MKVNKLTTSSPQPMSDRETVAKADPANSQFAFDLGKNKERLSKEKLNELLEEITEQGEKLASIPTYAELKAYRGLVSKFLNEVVTNMYAVDSQNGWDRQGRQKMYTTIKQIDQELAGLAEDVRAGQEKQIGIAAKLDTIRGLLVDLYM
ncbi:YaaR family protein [Acetonema longum]|uniref:DUF327 domain-containing protein n=1 Tax=Acetonema longum DSM 6540 TaxID=1009370 RepID=F7NDD1_9FIRM|nr:YaaR family protein [Acetonema longum]EGO65963.1 hypothetical protein ALO_00190 [Acetonema longum DSM 6540]